MEHQANVATSTEANEPQTIDADNSASQTIDRPLITPKEFIRLIYMLSGVAVVVLSLAIWFMMSVA